jgi:hypothetical protein
MLAMGVLAGCDYFMDDFSRHWPQEDINVSWERGTEIIGALASFRADKGKYPDTLDALVPQYLAEIKPPLVGRPEWGYRARNEGQVFDLWFADGELTDVTKPISVYSSDAGRWGIFTGGF